MKLHTCFNSATAAPCECISCTRTRIHTHTSYASTRQTGIVVDTWSACNKPVATEGTLRCVIRDECVMQRTCFNASAVTEPCSRIFCKQSIACMLRKARNRHILLKRTCRRTTVPIALAANSHEHIMSMQTQNNHKESPLKRIKHTEKTPPHP
jgi:hypothetical protein